MYGIIRTLLWLSVLAVQVTKLRKSGKPKRKYICATMIFSLAFSVLLALFPFENYFITFHTPQEAFRYTNFEKVKLVVEGEESALVIGEEAKSDYIHLVVPKVESGWKVGRGIDTKFEKTIVEKNVIITLYKYKVKDEYYISVISTSGESVDIFDSCNSVFVALNDSDSIAKFFAYVTLYDENYFVIVDGHKYEV